MKGKVISYISAKKFGFISGEDGESYFLHLSSLLDKNNETKLVKDVVVEFEPSATPKGLAAKQVHVPEVNFKKQLVPFFTAKSNQPRYGQVAARHSLSTRFFKDANTGRSYIKQLATDIGCNAILNTNVEKRPFSADDNSYIEYSFSGDFALVTEDVPCNDDDECDNSVAAIAAQVTAISAQFAAVNKAEKSAKAKQLQPVGRISVIAVAAIFVVGLALCMALVI